MIQPDEYLREIQRAHTPPHPGNCSVCFVLGIVERQRQALVWAETFLARHDAFLQQQTPQLAHAMKDAADGLRAALSASGEPEQDKRTREERDIEKQRNLESPLGLIKPFYHEIEDR
jgi:hypothetical protein